MDWPSLVFLTYGWISFRASGRLDQGKFTLVSRWVPNTSLTESERERERDASYWRVGKAILTQKNSGVPQCLSARRHSSQKSIGKVDIPWWMWHYYLDKNWPHNNPIVRHRDRSSSMKTNSIVNTHLTGASCSTHSSTVTDKRIQYTTHSWLSTTDGFRKLSTKRLSLKNTNIHNTTTK